MKLKTKLILGFLIFVFVSALIGIISLYQFANLSQHFDTVPALIDRFAIVSSVYEKTSKILYYDEVLTQSVRNYAFTGDTMWRDRYYEYVPLLDDALILLPHNPSDSKYFDSISKSNKRLVELELLAISLIDNGKSDQAISILDGQEYSKHKNEYSDILNSYSHKYDVSFAKTTLNLDKYMDVTLQKLDNFFNEAFYVFQITLIGLILLSLFLGYVYASSIVSPFLKMQQNLRRIAKGRFDVIIEPKGSDEMKELIVEFNKMIQELKKLDYTKRNITSIVSHELRTPLVPIMGNIDILLSDKSHNLTSEQITRLVKIKDKCNFMKNLISDIIDLNKINERELSMDKKIISLNDILQEVKENYEYIFEQKDIEFHLDSQEIKLDGDKTRLFQVFSNLVANAIDFCPP
ncbi:MAG: histidine kinase dimerization/phospho-acceptor domain-containing protein, partial [Nitrosarchaeum sp.]